MKLHQSSYAPIRQLCYEAQVSGYYLIDISVSMHAAVRIVSIAPDELERITAQAKPNLNIIFSLH